MPRGFGNAYAFSVFNAMSFSIVAGTPMMLYFTSLGATATILGIVAAQASLMNLLQIPAASFVERSGYRSFVLKGWSTRTFFIMLIAAVVLLLDGMDRVTRMCMILFLLFCYQFSRGISVCAVLPWFTQLVPEKLRGKWISTDQTCINITVLSMAAYCMWYLDHYSQPWHFGFLFLVSGVAGFLSLWFLRRIPDVPVPEESKSKGPVPWKEIIMYRPFRKLLIFNFIVHSAFGVQGVFYLKFLKDLHGASDSYVLLLNVVPGLAVVLTLWTLGQMIDRVGNKPYLYTACTIIALHYTGWGLVAAGILPLAWEVMAPIQILGGVGGALFGVANIRLAMGVIPPMGRSHFFAILSSLQNLTVAIMPLIWGPVIDSCRHWMPSWLGVSWNVYVIMYIVISITLWAALVYAHRLEDKPGMTTQEFFEELLVNTPARTISRIWSRRPNFWIRSG